MSVPLPPGPAGVLTIDLDALARNYRALAARAVPAACGAVVKANAYGLGVAPVVALLSAEGCRHFFVACAEEGEALRELVPDASIYVFEGVVDGDRERLVRARLVPVLNSLEQVRCWSESHRPAALHVDTGMSRLGLTAQEVDRLAGEPRLLEGVPLALVLTHLACADEPQHALNCVQLTRFEALRRRLPLAPTSIANSAGLFLGAEHRGDLVRPGIALYGGNPFIDRPNPMEPVVALKGRILQLREVGEVSTVGYGASCHVRPPARLAVVGVGYADGYRRALGNRGSACVDGQRVPIVGRVSMDLVCLDVTAVEPARVRPGAWVDLIGGGVSLDEVAAAAGTISYEILTGLGGRLRREYVRSTS